MCLYYAARVLRITSLAILTLMLYRTIILLLIKLKSLYGLHTNGSSKSAWITINNKCVWKTSLLHYTIVKKTTIPTGLKLKSTRPFYFCWITNEWSILKDYTNSTKRIQHFLNFGNDDTRHVLGASTPHNITRIHSDASHVGWPR